MQKRLARKLDLERLLSKVKPHPTPTPSLEQYTISAKAAATMLYIAAYADEDIAGKNVLDMGCGTGRLALGAAFLGAKCVTGVDIDKKAVKTARENASEAGLNRKLQWVAADIDVIHGRFDTVLQNPPFGVQKRGADRKFMKKALELGTVTYSLHKRPGEDSSLLRMIKTCSDGAIKVCASPFMQRFVGENGGRIDSVYALLMSVPHMFSFHTEKMHDFVVDLYVVRKE
jgi:putative methylase